MEKVSSSLESFGKYASVTPSKLSVDINVHILYVGKLYTRIKIQPPLYMSGSTSRCRRTHAAPSGWMWRSWSAPRISASPKDLAKTPARSSSTGWRATGRISPRRPARPTGPASVSAGSSAHWLETRESSDTPTNVGTTNVGNHKHRNDKRRKI